MTDRAPLLANVLRERTDIFVAQRSVLAIAPGAGLHATLASLAHLRYRRADTAAAAGRELVAESVDVAVIDTQPSPGPLHDLARLLRPGGRLIAGVPAGLAASLSLGLAAAGFLATHAHEDADTSVLLAVRGILVTRR